MQQSSWNKIAHLSANTPSERWGQSSCTILNELVIFGGFQDSTYFNDIWVFDTLNLEWRQVFATGQIPQERSNASLNLHSNGKDLVLFGGGSRKKERFNSIHVLNWQTKEWKLVQVSKEQDIPDPRTYQTANIIGKYLVVFGGEDLTDFNDLWLFDLEKYQWNEVKLNNNEVKPSERRFHASCQRNNELVVVGGCKGKYDTIQDIYTMKFDEFLKTGNTQYLAWKMVSINSGQNLLSRWGHSISYNQLNGKIYAFGGRNQTGDLNSLIQIDLQNEKAVQVNVCKNLRPSPRRRHSSNIIGNSLVIFGGFSGSYFNDLHCIEIGLSKFLEKKEDESLKEFINGMKIKYVNWIDSQIEEKISNGSRSDYSIQDTEEFRVLVDLFDPNFQHQMKREEETHQENAIVSKQSQLKSSQTQQWITKQTKIQEIVILREQAFQKYKRDNIKKIQKDKFNPEIERFNHEIISQGEETQESFFKEKERRIQIEINGQQKILVRAQIKTKNRYFANCLMHEGKINMKSLTNPKDMKVFCICIMYIQSDILVVPQGLSLKDWVKLLELADYFCAQSLVHTIQKFLIQQATLQHISELIQISTCHRLPQLANKCSELIINQHYEKFVKENIDIKEKHITDKFNQFESSLWDKIFDAVRYPAKFSQCMMRYFEANHFSMIVKFMNKVRENEEKKLKHMGQNKGNQGAQDANLWNIMQQLV